MPIQITCEHFKSFGAFFNCFRIITQMTITNLKSVLHKKPFWVSYPLIVCNVISNGAFPDPRKKMSILSHTKRKLKSILFSFRSKFEIKNIYAMEFSWNRNPIQEFAIFLSRGFPNTACQNAVHFLSIFVFFFLSNSYTKFHARLPIYSRVVTRVRQGGKR